MINFIFLTLVILGLVFLYFQQRMNSKQEALIKSEIKALKKLRKNNKSTFLNRRLTFERDGDTPKDIYKPIPKAIIPQVRNFEFPKSVKRRSKTSMISN